MKGVLMLVLAGTASPALAQHAGHASPPVQPASSACAPEHAAMGHCTLTSSPAPTADPHAGHAASEANIPAAPPPAAALSGPEHSADLTYHPAAMSASREALRREHGGLTAYRLLIEQAELKVRDGRDGYGWDAQAWYGRDRDKLWIKSEGEGAFGASLDRAEVQGLWSRALDPWFDLQLGVRYDIAPDPEGAYLVAGIQGLAPYWFELDSALFLSSKGDVSARFEGEYDLRIARNLILQPRVDVDLSAQDVPDLGTGSGLSEAGLGVRLRYEVFPGSGPASIAPYIGVEYQRAFGDTARFRRTAGDEVGGWNFLVGLRTWL